MRNAAAQFDDYGFDEPARKAKGARKPRRAAAKPKSGRAPKRSRMRYAHYAAIGLSATMTVGIMVNALVMQHARHPAPLFGKAIALGNATPATAAQPVNQPAPPAAATSAAPLASEPVAPPAPASAASPPRAHHPAADAPPPHARAEDPIAKLLRASAPAGDKVRDGDKMRDGAKVHELSKAHEAGKPQDGAKTQDGAKDGAKSVLAAQHALVKLGFVVKPTGTFGPGTRSAIEAFERDQHLPVKGEMSRKVLKQLSAESGIAID